MSDFVEEKRRIKLHIHRANHGEDGAITNSVDEVMCSFLARIPTEDVVEPFVPSRLPAHVAAPSLAKGLGANDQDTKPAVHNEPRKKKSNKPDGPASKPATSLGDALEQTDQNLIYELAEHGFPISTSIMQVMLDWASTQSMQIGVRRPEPDDCARLFSLDPDRDMDHTDLLRAGASDAMQAITITPARIKNAISQLLSIHRARKLEPKATEQTLYVLRPWHHDENGKQTAEPGQEYNDLTESSEIDDQLRDFAKTLLACLPHVPGENSDPYDLRQLELLAGAKPNSAWVEPAAVTADETRKGPITKFPKRPMPVPKYTNIVGLKVVWAKVRLTHTEDETQIGEEAAVPVALVNNDLSLIQLSDVPKHIPWPKGISPTTEGLHFYRMTSDFAHHAPDNWTAAEHEALRKQTAANVDTQTRRDHKLFDAHLRKAALKTAKIPKRTTFMAPVNPAINGHLRARSGVRDGGLLVCVPDTGTWDIHVFENEDALDTATQRKLFDDQIAMKSRNRIALSVISYMSGSLYSDKKMLKIKGKSVVRNFHIPAKAAMAVVSVGVIMGISMIPFVTPVALALVGLGSVGIKRVVANTFITNPNKNLKDKSFLKEKLKLSKNAIPEAETKHALAIAQLIEAQSDAEDDIEPIANPLPLSIQSAAKKAADAAFAKQADFLMTGDVGDILRRGFVHFLRASEILAASTGESDDKKIEEAGRAIHHIEKGWRYMAPSVIYLGLAWREYLAANDIWMVQSKQASAALMTEYMTLLDAGKINHSQDVLLRDLESVLGGNIAKKRWWKHKRKKDSEFLKKMAQHGLTPADIELDETTGVAIYDMQLEAFKQDAFGPTGTIGQGTKFEGPKTLDETRKLEVAVPELYANWQIRGGELEPYRRARQKGGSAGGTPLGVDGKKVSELERRLGVDLMRLSNMIGQRMDVYDEVRPVGRDEMRGDRLAIVRDRRTGIVGDLAHGMYSIGPKFYEGWKDEDEAGNWRNPHSKLFHTARNFYDKRTKLEMAKVGVASLVDLIPGMWVNFGFSSFADTIRLRPTGDGYLMDILDARKEKPASSVEEAQAKVDENTKILREIGEGDMPKNITAGTETDVKTDGDTGRDTDGDSVTEDLEKLREKGSASIDRLSINSCTAIARLLAGIVMDQVSAKMRKDDFDASQILTLRQRGERERGRVAAQFLLPNVAPGEPGMQADPRLDLKHDPEVARAGLKSGSAYVGGNITKKIGARLMLMATSRTTIIEATANVVNGKSAIKAGDKGTGIEKMAKLLKPHAEYHSAMSGLQTDLVTSLTYLNLLAFVGGQIEDTALDRIKLKDKLLKEIPWVGGEK